MSFWVYILRCADGSYYTGHTDDLERRIAQHRSGEIPGYTHDRRPVELVWSEYFPTRDDALAAEMQIKPWSRAKKEALIQGDWRALSIAALPPAEREACTPRLRSGRTEVANNPLEQHPFMPSVDNPVNQHPFVPSEVEAQPLRNGEA